MRVMFNGYAKPEVGGPQGYALVFQSEMRARGFDVVGIMLRRPETGLSGGNRIQIAQDSVRLYEVDLGTSQVVYGIEPGLPPVTLEAIDRLVSILKSEAPDVLVLNGFSLANACLAKAATFLKIPLIFSHHGFWSAEIPGTLPQAAQERMRKMEQEAIRDAHVNVYLNEWSIGRAREAYPATIRSDDLVIPLPFNPVFLRTSKAAIASDGRPLVGFVARWDPIKNIGLVRAFAESAKDMRIVSPIRIGGRKSLQDEEELFRTAVEPLEPMSQETLAGLYRSCDLLILPSRFDVSPTVVMEAALQGRGTIISDGVGWLPTYERLGMEDWIVRDPTPERLEAAVRRCLGKPVPSAFVDEILERHHPDRVFDAWASLLTSRI